MWYNNCVVKAKSDKLLLPAPEYKSDPRKAILRLLVCLGISRLRGSGVARYEGKLINSKWLFCCHGGIE